MAEDLGTWPPEQATVLLEVLQQAGLSPQARRTREGIVVTVPSEQSDEAHRQLVANMDAIARAARGTGGGARRRPSPARPSRTPSREGESRLTSERLMRRAQPLAVLIVGLLVSAVLPGMLRWIGLIATVAGVIYVIGKQDQNDGGGD